MKTEKDRKLRIVFLTNRNAKDKREWSGTLYYMAQAMSKYGCEVSYVGPYQPKFVLFFLKTVRKLSETILHKKYNIAYSIVLAYFHKWFFTKKIREINPDVIFAGSSSSELSLINLKIPKVFLADATFELLINNYPNFTNLTKLSLKEGDYIERKALYNADVLVFSSQWAIDSARDFYKIPTKRLHLISYGANLDQEPERAQVIGKKIDKQINLLFLGVDWIRKGGADVYRVFSELLARGINVQLTVCGCQPPVDAHPQLIVHKFLNKNKAEDFQILYKILLETHFLYVPSRSDCTPIVFCEASAYAIPVLTTNVGGIPSVVVEGINGHTFPLDKPTGEIADLICSYVDNPHRYTSLSESSRNFYESNLNWNIWGEKMSKIFRNLVNN